MKLIYWNAQGIKSKLHELKAFLDSNDIPILLLGETFLKPNQTLKIPNYTTYRNDRPGNRVGGGTAILIKNHLKHDQLPELNLDNIETTSLQLRTNTGPINIHAAYSPPTSPIRREDLSKIFDSQLPTLLIGNLNAKHPYWNSNIVNTKGTTLTRIADLENLIVSGPTEPTHTHAATGTQDVLDIVVLKHLTVHHSITVLDDPTSDHRPIEVTIDSDIHNQPKQIKITNWKTFGEVLKITPINITTRQDINPAIEKFEKEVNEAVELSTKTKEATNSEPIPTGIRIKIVEKRSIYREYRRTLYPPTKQKLNKITNEIKEDLKNFYNDQWDNKISKLSVEDNSLWSMSKALKIGHNKTSIPPLKKDNETAITDIQKAEMFADVLEATFQPNEMITKYEHYYQHIENTITNNRPSSDPQIDVVTHDEINEIIANLKPKKAPGKEGITNKIIKRLPPEGIQAIADITNAIFLHKYFPLTWKEAQIIMIKKPGKKGNEPGGYRPISILPNISKITERALHKRLEEQLETQEIIPHFQFGFRKEHSTTHALTRLQDTSLQITTNQHQQRPSFSISRRLSTECGTPA